MEVQRRLHEQLEVSFLNSNSPKKQRNHHPNVWLIENPTLSHGSTYDGVHQYTQVQRRLQLRIEAQGKYLQSILEKACKAIEEQAVAFAGLEAAREELSELAIKVSNGCQGTTSTLDTNKMTIPSVSELAVAIEHKNNCSAESSLTSSTVGSPVSAVMMKKRHRGVFGNGDSAVVGDEAGWVMPSSSIG